MLTVCVGSLFLTVVMMTGSCRSAEINVAEGRKQAAILKSEAEKAQLINEAEGQVKIVFNKHMRSWRCFMTWIPGQILFSTQARAVIVAGEARASSLRAVADALGGAQVTL